MSGRMRYYLIEYFDHRGYVTARICKKFACAHDARYFAYAGMKWHGNRYAVYIKV
ncbi:hypothetical protein M2451_002024 [Dysgonomonas sp. PFB1-18]|nr:hypothetical protein [Dysgonomonas sp. PF1-14]MDH6339200.1 hypothetical protein [Dysgonomonas sp. PF1-16]MDH6380699.1 hypothetical protein [Dysgonomonas sp. PFB1-18]MDH6398195.1 hypothetical protein [Dysgonomonas sp. PF1-23]